MKNFLFDTIEHLSEIRPVFHSEADFQFALGWELKRSNDNFEIMMERPFQFPDDPKNHPKIKLDILIKDNSSLKKFGLELKYVTKKLYEEINGEIFDLKDHMAADLRRYDIYKDMSRLEYLKDKKEINKGYMIFLTNVSSYLKSSNGMAQDFNFSENHKIVPGEYYWSGKKINSKSIGSSRKEKLNLKQQYECKWVNYSKKYEFQLLLLEVK